MKKTLFFALLLMLAACNTTYTTTEYYYQIAQTAPVDGKTKVNSNGQYLYEDENCTITMDLWSEGGQMNFTVYNKTAEILYIDMDKCLLVKNGISYNTFTTGGSVKDGNITLYRTAQGIAPHSTCSFSGIGLAFGRLEACDWETKATKQHPIGRTYDPENTPANIANYICYHMANSDNVRMAVTKFYISSVTNYLKEDILTYETETSTNCTGYSTDVRYKQYHYSPATGFYVTYTETIVHH